MSGIDHTLLEFYLIKKGWTKVETNRESIDIYIEPHVDIPFEIILPNRKFESGYDLNINDAIRILSEIENRPVEKMIETIKKIDHDFYDFRIKTNQQDSVSFDLLNELLNVNRHVFSQASQKENRLVYDRMDYTKKRNALSPRDAAKKYIKDCQFTHTWKGSFGITIETPLYLPSLGLIEDIPENTSRRTTKRIIDGYILIENAVIANSSSFIIDNSENEADILVFERLPELQSSIRREEIEISVNFSPILKLDKKYIKIPRPHLNSKALRITEDAINQVKYTEQELDIDLVGFPKTIHASKEDLLKDTEGSNRRVIVEGVSRKINHVSLKMDLSLEDYKKAIRAQDEVRNIRLKCRVKKKSRGWEVVNVESFELLN
ncbi:MAG: hypothetical protein H6696_01485 [Deferribacteres bacterium]|nr:hypothetical protein [Deferribacteres bacterium]